MARPESGRFSLAIAGLAGLALMTAAFYPMRGRELPAWAAASLAAGIALWIGVAWGGASFPEPAAPKVQGTYLLGRTYPPGRLPL